MQARKFYKQLKNGKQIRIFYEQTKHTIILMFKDGSFVIHSFKFEGNDVYDDESYQDEQLESFSSFEDFMERLINKFPGSIISANVSNKEFTHTSSIRHLSHFKEYILAYFSSLIEKHELNVIYKDTEVGNSVKLINDNCIIEFTYDRGELGCTFSKEGGAKLLCELVYDSLSKERKVNISINDSPEEQIRKYSLMIEECLEPVLEGAFSWEIWY